MKKVFLLIIAVLLSSILLAACGGGGGMPEGDNVITIGLPKQAMVGSYGSDNAFTAWLEEQTGYDIEVIEFATKDTDYKTQLATMIASGEKLPDILFSFKVGDALRSEYGQQGYFIDLKPYYENDEVNGPIKSRIDAMDEQARKWMYHKLEDPDTGAYYSFINGNVNDMDCMRYMPWINQGWLDKLGLPMPQNTEQLIEVLTAFRDRDPNGNGKNDEIPCMGNTSNMGGDVIGWLINMKLQMDYSSWINLDANGNPYAPAVTDEYRDAVKWVHDLMDQGLVSKLSVTTAGNTLAANIAAGDLIGIVVGHPTILFPDKDLSNWTPMPIWGYSYYEESALSLHTFITEDCDNPDAAWDLMMLFYTDEGEYRCRFGAPGVDWDWADEGAVNVYGTPATMKIINDVYTETQSNNFWRVFNCMGIIPYDEMLQAGSMNDREKDYWNKVAEMMDNYTKASNADTGNITVQHRLMWTEDLKKEVPYRTDVTGLFNTYTDKFCVGQLDPYSDETWASYLKELNDATYQKWIATMKDVVKNSLDHGVK